MGSEDSKEITSTLLCGHGARLNRAFNAVVVSRIYNWNLRGETLESVPFFCISLLSTYLF
jgi:hypothetical protein